MNNNGAMSIRKDKMETWTGDEISTWLEERLTNTEVCETGVFAKGKIKELSCYVKAASSEEVSHFVTKMKNQELHGEVKMNKVQRKKIKELMYQQDEVADFKTYIDQIYGACKLSPLIAIIIKQPEFTRMRKIKQLGCADYVFSTAIGNRFQHSVGTAILTKRLLADYLLTDQKERNLYDIEDKDIDCVVVAALCHDLGHALLSHFFDGTFIKQKLPVKDPYSNRVITQWNHEMASQLLMDRLFERDEVCEVMTDYGLNYRDKIFIKELIDPVALQDLKATDPWPMKGRDEDKAFLYEIVSNKRNGIDTDKLDYLQRDSKLCRLKDPMPSIDRIFINTEIAFEPENPERTMLSYCDKLYTEHTIHEIFKVRLSNHRQIYQHRDGCAVELMHGQALLEVQDSYTVKGANGKPYKLHEAIHCMEAYMQITDFVADNILNGGMALELVELKYGEKELQKWLQAKEILEKAQRGDYYSCLGQIEVKPGKEKELSSANHIKIMKEEIVRETNKALRLQTKNSFNQDSQPEITTEDLIHKSQVYNWGMKNKNPIDKVPFIQNGKVFPIYYREKNAPLEPQMYNEFHIRLYCKQRYAKNEASAAFKQYCQKSSLQFKGGQDLGPTTPMKPLTPQINDRKRKGDTEENVSCSIATRKRASSIRALQFNDD